MVEVVAALIWDKEKFLICQRPKNKARALLWEFVGGKVEQGETKEQALIRECKEELNITLNVGDVFMEVVHEYPDISVHLTLFNATIIDGVPQKLEHNDIKWITSAEIPNYDFCPADKEILKKLKLGEVTMKPIKQYNEIALPKLNKSQKASIYIATNIVSNYPGEEFEQFILEWLKYCSKKIDKSSVLGRIGGTGDYGIDIYEKTNDKVTYYQCKRYSKQLTEPQTREIIVKVLWYAFNQRIEMPNQLVIIAFKGFNQKTLTLLGDKVKLKESVIQNVDESLKDINVNDNSAAFVEYINNLDSFDFITVIDIDTIVTEYCLSEYCQFRFLSGAKIEVNRVVLPKGEYSQEKFCKELMNITTTKKERVLLTAKDQYYSALCLKETDRYLYGSDDEFLKFKDEVSSVIEPARQRNYDSLSDRHLAIIESAMSTIPSNVALDYDLHIITNKDKAGVCHIMVNEGTLSWENEDE